jgi:hypothetical protein
MSKFNLMEDYYGSDWAKTPEKKYLSPSDCTVGNKFDDDDDRGRRFNLIYCLDVVAHHRIRQRQEIAARPSVCHSSHSGEIPAPTG